MCVGVCSEAASKAAAIGGWPPPEIAAIDAALPQRWWQPQVLAAFEGALSSMCLPGMPASLGASPQEGTTLRVQVAHMACGNEEPVVHRRREHVSTCFNLI